MFTAGIQYVLYICSIKLIFITILKMRKLLYFHFNQSNKQRINVITSNWVDDLISSLKKIREPQFKSIMKKVNDFAIFNLTYILLFFFESISESFAGCTESHQMRSLRIMFITTTQYSKILPISKNVTKWYISYIKLILIYVKSYKHKIGLN